MAFCTECGAADQTGKFCGECGHALSITTPRETTPTSAPPAAPPKNDSGVPAENSAPSRNNRGILTVLGVVTMILVIVGIALAVNGKKTSSSASDTTTGTVSSSSTSDTSLEEQMVQAVYNNWDNHCWSNTSDTPAFYTVWSRWIGDAGLVSLTEQPDGTGWSGVSFQVTDNGSSWQVIQTSDSPIEDDTFAFLGTPAYQCENFSVPK
jgi:hypothetical protein